MWSSCEAGSAVGGAGSEYMSDVPLSWQCGILTYSILSSRSCTTLPPRIILREASELRSTRASPKRGLP
eukprot:scaffold2643_cov117-Isochrysis_galbana.AAC.4